MAGAKLGVHHQYVPEFGPVSRFVPPTLQVHEAADPGGGQPTEPNALVFTEPDGESHVWVMSDKTRRYVIELLTGGIVVAPATGGGGAGGGPLSRGGNGQ